jgi:hypothetical protein
VDGTDGRDPHSRRGRTLLVGLLVILGASSATAQIIEIQPVDFMLRGSIDSAGGGAIEHARIIVTRTDDGTVLVDRAFSDVAGDFVTVFQADAEVELGLGDPPGGDLEPGPRFAGNWMGAGWPNPIQANGELHLTLPYSAPDGAKNPPILDLFDTRGRRIEPRQTIASGVYF